MRGFSLDFNLEAIPLTLTLSPNCCQRSQGFIRGGEGTNRSPHEHLGSVRTPNDHSSYEF